ncbi:MAG TPA: hypothetical protein HA330_05000 [Candidatus Thalassarchaeaceae archaeon]|nr:MAG TPA: hypothetical protein D7H85_04990 [Candidatus Poseidoniales archaeon]HII49227.1 hypothetical protein [Candidatus Thalassarchaeaceae archaeon]|tara:strand:- start:565 stop:963 length:399 start_codon:yes stop_codon:yes gene_type:complete
MTLKMLTDAIRSRVDEGMEENVAESIAEHALGFFGFSNRIIDNALEPTDRNLFYQLQDYELLTTESEETTLWDGREWRIHYWKFKPKRVSEVAHRTAVEEEVDPYAGLYDEVPTDIWREQAGFEHDDNEPLF